MKADEIRESFLEFFESRSHDRVASGSLVPAHDPTLLFTNAGMVQFKDIFLGRENTTRRRATSSQRCLRVGGKHNDLENVGYTARHHTFFEMLGNFSFGDYFKREAIAYAWEFLTQTLRLPPARLWVTVFEDDTAAADIWLQDIGVDPGRFARVGKRDNFWAMGDEGPCGPCTEIFYDHGTAVVGAPPGTAGQEGDRFVEIWNLVFMQYERDHDGTMHPLDKPSVDTGMGLERIAAVLQGVHSNYDTDLFRSLIQRSAAIIGTRDLTTPSLRVISDHIRACSFLVTDGVLPTNEGRGYVLRRIIRRAVRHGHKLGVRTPFFHRLVAAFSEVMGTASRVLVERQSFIESVLQKEEERFAETLEAGLSILDAALERRGDDTIAGALVFKLYDTYGFPVDLTADIARERQLALDMEGFEQLMARQKSRARAAARFYISTDRGLVTDDNTTFSGYLRAADYGVVKRLFVGGNEVATMPAGAAGMVILDNTPFYAESGGQVGDTGRLRHMNNVFVVTDTQKHAAAHQHIGRMKIGRLARGDTVCAEIDVSRRASITLNHSATHLLHAALRKHLGTSVCQKGSLVDAQRLRFDFSHDRPLTQQDLTTVERMINEQVRRNCAAKDEVMPKEQAFEKGAIALFGEKYADSVRTMTIGDFSMELCGGTHVHRAGDIGLFKITSESGVAAGVRRIEAMTGDSAWQLVHRHEQRLKQICTLLKSDAAEVAERVDRLLRKNRALEKQVNACQARLASGPDHDLAAQAETVGSLKVLAARLDDIDRRALRRVLDQMKNKLGSAAIVLASENDGCVHLVAGVTKDCTDKLHASNLVNMVAQQVGGRGGGKRPDMAEAGGTKPAALAAALASVPAWVREQIQ